MAEGKEGKATTVRFSDEIYRQLEQASRVSGLPINSIVVVACLEWLQERCGLPGLPIGPTAWLPRTLTRLEPGLLAGGRGWRAFAEPPTGYSFESLSPTARAAMSRAQLEADRAGHNYIGTEHLLLALTAEPSLAQHALSSLGIEESAVRQALAGKLRRPSVPPGKTTLPTSRVRSVVRHAFEEAQGANAAQVGSEHLLLGILLEGEGVAAHVLRDLGANLEHTREAVARLSES